MEKKFYSIFTLYAVFFQKKRHTNRKRIVKKYGTPLNKTAQKMRNKQRRCIYLQRYLYEEYVRTDNLMNKKMTPPWEGNETIYSNSNSKTPIKNRILIMPKFKSTLILQKLKIFEKWFQISHDKLEIIATYRYNSIKSVNLILYVINFKN